MTQTQHNAIAEQAYFLWLNDGMVDGRADAHWAAAEMLVAKAAMSMSAAPKAVKAKRAKAKTATTPRAARIRATETRLHS